MSYYSCSHSIESPDTLQNTRIISRYFRGIWAYFRTIFAQLSEFCLLLPQDFQNDRLKKALTSAIPDLKNCEFRDLQKSISRFLHANSAVYVFISAVCLNSAKNPLKFLIPRLFPQFQNLFPRMPFAKIRKRIAEITWEKFWVSA